MTDFEAHLEETREGPLVFAFASENDFRFEWGHYLDHINVPHVLFRDSYDQLYTDGVAGIGGIDRVVDYIRLKVISYTTSIALGLSKGGYAALRFGKLSGVTRIIAISPLTGTGKDLHPDFPVHLHHRVAHDDRFILPDLKPFFADLDSFNVEAFISNGESCDMDYTMVSRLGIKNITLIPGYSHGGVNNLAKGMRDNGMLDKLILGN